jgi:hypothetical protein
MPTLLPLPIAPETAITRVIAPALAVLPGHMRSAVAVVLMLAIALQESRLAHRWQVVDVRHPERKGPARGLWQFELGGGVAGVCSHPASRTRAQVLCTQRAVPFEPRAIWDALDDDDLLAAGMARLLLWTDPQPLPAAGQVEAAWQYYLRNWRPGAYSNGDAAARASLRAKWGRNYATALAAHDAVEA